MDSGAADQVALRQLAQAVAVLSVAEDGGPIEDQGFPSDVPAFELGSPHASAHSLDDQAAFEFGDRADDYDDCPAQRAAGVDLFAEADELDVEPVQLVQNLEEVLSGPGDPVTSPDQNDIELAAAGITHHRVQSRPAGFRSADPVLVLFHDLIAPLRSHLMEVVHLSFRVLFITCKDAGNSLQEGPPDASENSPKIVDVSLKSICTHFHI